MIKLGNLVEDSWIEGTGEGKTLYNAISGVPIASASTDGIDISSIYDFARSNGGYALRRMTFQERGIMASWTRWLLNMAVWSDVWSWRLDFH